MRLPNRMSDKGILTDLFTFNSLVDSLSKEGFTTEAHNLLDMMIQRGIKPDTITFNTLIDGYCLIVRTKY